MSYEHSLSCGRGGVVQALPRSRSGSIHRIAPYTPHPILRPPHLPHPPHHTRRVQPAALLRLTLRVSVRCSLHARRTASSRTPTRGRAPRDARTIKHRRTLPPSCIRLRAALLTPRPSSLPQVTPSHEINLIKPGKIVVTNYCCWRRARWYCLTHVRLTGSHMHSIFIRQVQALLYLLLALY